MRREALAVVEVLNEMLYSQHNFTPYSSDDLFTFTSTGSVEVIRYGEIYLWDSDNDMREWNRTTGQYEPELQQHILNLFSNHIDKLINVLNVISE